MTVDRDDWIVKAACRGLPPEWWLPSRTGNQGVGAAGDEAMQICLKACPVRRECAQRALDLGTAHGIVAGVDLGSNYTYQRPTDRAKRALQAVANGEAA